ncbi:MAG TPA: hypothetical protein VMX18_03520 [Candidatus Bipolaricaulota bacterium]|nr:hypothetical protein [Candidatus Bipolaricaulota bacterium]
MTRRPTLDTFNRVMVKLFVLQLYNRGMCDAHRVFELCATLELARRTRKKNFLRRYPGADAVYMLIKEIIRQNEPLRAALADLAALKRRNCMVAGASARLRRKHFTEILRLISHASSLFYDFLNE